MKKLLVISCFLIFLPLITWASHIVGGVLTYEYLGNYNYKVKLKLYKDCGHSSIGYPGSVSIMAYYNHGTQYRFIRIPRPPVTTLNPVVDTCVVTPDVCVQEAIYEGTIYLPPVEGGYHLLYDVCCRNFSVDNINGGSTGEGFYAYVPSDTLVINSQNPSMPPDTVYFTNSSPKFNNFPPIYMCAGKTFSFDNSASDPDGDSLSYYICTPYADWYTLNYDSNGKPDIPLITSSYYSGFSAQNPFGPGGFLNMDSVTGELVGLMPSVPIGGSNQYVVGVCVDEFRDGEYISTVKRDFQFNSVYCPPIPTDIIYDTSLCSSYTIQFPNAFDPGTQGVFWDFGDPTTNADTFNTLSPTYTYPATGTYTITLIVNRGTPCEDTAIAIVSVNSVVSGFNDDDPGCQGEPINFSDSSYTSSNAYNTSWSWNFGDGLTGSGQNVQHSYTQPGSYSVRLITFNNFGCSDTTIQLVKIDSQVVVNAGTDFTVCSNEPSISITGSVSGSTGIEVWRTTGTGTFTDSTSLNTTYTFSQNDALLNDSLIFLLVSTDGLCHDVSDSMVVHFTPVPLVDAGNDVYTCTNNSVSELKGTISRSGTVQWSSTVPGTFSPHQDSLHTFFTPDFAPIPGDSIVVYLSTTGVGNCIATQDSLTIIYTPAPTVEAGKDVIICANDLPVLLHASVSGEPGIGINWSGPLGSVFGNRTDSITTYRPANSNIPPLGSNISDTATVFITTTGSALCKEVMDSLRVIIAPQPFLTAGDDLQTCSIDDSIHIKNSATNNVVQSVSWATTNGNNSNFSDRHTVQTSYKTSPGDIPAPGDTHSTFLTFILQSTQVNYGCLNVFDTMMVEIRPQPMVHIHIDADDICADEKGLEVYADFINSDSIAWETPSVYGSYIDPSKDSTLFMPGNYSVSNHKALVKVQTVGNGVCPAALDSMELVITDLPKPYAGEDRMICRSSSILLTGYDSLGSGQVFTWYDSSGTRLSTDPLLNTPAIPLSSFFDFEITDTNGCKARDTVRVEVLDPPVLDLPPHYCTDDTLVLHSNATGIPSPPLNGQFEWHHNGIILLGTSANASEYATTSGTGKYVVLWKEGDCQVRDTTVVTERPLLNSIGSTICQGNTAIISTTEGYVSYTWQERGGLEQILSGSSVEVKGLNDPNTAQVFVVEVEDSLGCTQTDSVYLRELTLPEINIAPDYACEGVEVTLSGQPQNNEDYDSLTSVPYYTWYFNGDSVGSTPNYMTLENGIYLLRYQLEACIAFDTLSLIFNSNPREKVQDSATFCPQSDGSVEVDGGEGNGIVSWDWFFDDLFIGEERIMDLEIPGNYMVIVTDSNNCQDTGYVTVAEYCPPSCHFPTAFIPDGTPCDPDCARDDDISCPDNCFYAFCKNEDDFQLTIFNRWGEVVFFSDDANHIWDGSFRDKILPGGSYGWMLQYNAIDKTYNRVRKMTGKVIIVR